MITISHDLEAADHEGGIAFVHDRGRMGEHWGPQIALRKI